ncbi:hypothetical protein SLEP1_g4460 [Rubroshorea leprosula]|uniref:Uncharacterized protein n=1 Tax=Rubroshorea leprosula TaxID=152421 RepID=A0AAV5HUR0_9ROSI|nr:hypothetical protein SLEP1_g4460 [Rubroshorea leprosula]
MTNLRQIDPRVFSSHLTVFDDHLFDLIIFTDHHQLATATGKKGSRWENGSGFEGGDHWQIWVLEKRDQISCTTPSPFPAAENERFHSNFVNAGIISSLRPIPTRLKIVTI